MQLKGVAFAPYSSVRHEASLDLSQPGLLSVSTVEEVISDAESKVSISEPVGQLPIRFSFANGWVFVTDCSPQLEHWLGNRKPSGKVRLLEKNVFAWVACTLLCLVVGLAGYRYGLPILSQSVAKMVPDSMAVALGNKVLDALDQNLEPSKLSLAQQNEIRYRVAQYTSQLPPLPYDISVEFRSSEMGANAFALPGGKIILLDELVELTNTAEQLDSVILHELGHVHHKHMLTKLVYSSLLSVTVAVITGESSGVIDTLAGVGVFIAASGHSRTAEIEADIYAKQAMLTIFGSSEAMAEMFELLQDTQQVRIPDWFSTHPDIQQRIDDARK